VVDVVVDVVFGSGTDVSGAVVFELVADTDLIEKTIRENINWHL
jgi:hypothetical protein